MKKLVLILALSLGLATVAFSQSQYIGGRSGGYGGELSYQKDLNSSGRLEADLGWSYSYLGLTGLYQWVKPIGGVQGLEWFYGGGATVGFGSGLYLGVAGNIGIDYNFSFPLQIGLDYRPTLFILPSISGGWTGYAFSARYRF
jgi:hypothetical protein